MIIRQENEPNNGSVWRWGHNGFQKTFQCLFCSVIAFLILDSHFSSKKLLSVYGLLESSERRLNLSKEKENHAEFVTISMELHGRKDQNIFGT